MGKIHSSSTMSLAVRVTLYYCVINAHLLTPVVSSDNVTTASRLWPPGGNNWFWQLRLVRREIFMHYQNPGYADDTQWFHICKDDTCDHYSAGTSQCIFHTSRPVSADSSFGRERPTGRSYDTVLLNSNCQMRSEGAGPFHYQLLHCPRNLPVAVFMLPKSGTTSTLNWLIGAEDVWPTLLEAAGSMRKTPRDMVEWLSSEAGWWEITQEKAQAIANRVMHRYPVQLHDHPSLHRANIKNYQYTRIFTARINSSL